MATFFVVNVWFMLLLLLLWLLCLCLLYNDWCDCGWSVVLLLCGVDVSVVLRLLQLGLCSDTIAISPYVIACEPTALVAAAAADHCCKHGARASS